MKKYRFKSYYEIIRSIHVWKHENNNQKHQMGTKKHDINTLKHQIDAAKHITTLNKGMGMIALVQSRRGTTHINLKQ